MPLPPMTETGWADGFFTWLKTRITSKTLDVVLTSFTMGDIPERTIRPYAYAMPNAVRDQKFTNKNKYATLEFTVTIVADTLAMLDGTLAPAVTDAMQHAPAVVTPTAQNTGPLSVQMIRPGDIVYAKEEQIWTAELTFYASCSQPAVASPS